MTSLTLDQLSRHHRHQDWYRLGRFSPHVDSLAMRWSYVRLDRNCTTVAIAKRGVLEASRLQKRQNSSLLSRLPSRRARSSEEVEGVDSKHAGTRSRKRPKLARDFRSLPRRLPNVTYSAEIQFNSQFKIPGVSGQGKNGFTRTDESFLMCPKNLANAASHEKDSSLSYLLGPRPLKLSNLLWRHA